MIVLDASAALRVLLPGADAAAVIGLLEPHEGEIHAPALLDVEVAQVVRRMALGDAIPIPVGRAVVELLQELPVARHPMTPLLPRIWDLRDNLTAYDAAYVALAEALDAPLLTLDRRLARAPGHRAEIALVGT